MAKANIAEGKHRSLFYRSLGLKGVQTNQRNLNEPTEMNVNGCFVKTRGVKQIELTFLCFIIIDRLFFCSRSCILSCG